VWCGVVWCGVVWCGVVWCGVAVLIQVRRMTREYQGSQRTKERRRRRKTPQHNATHEDNDRWDGSTTIEGLRDVMGENARFLAVTTWCAASHLGFAKIKDTWMWWEGEENEKEMKWWWCERNEGDARKT
jgi:hypothetical protein